MRALLCIFIVAVIGCGKVGAPPNGSACTTGTACASGFCPSEDGICCDRACDGECESCKGVDTGGANGTCAPVTANSDPAAECADHGAAACGANGTGCSGTSAACNVYPAATVCMPTACTGASLSNGKCDGAGTCDSTPTSCDLYQCNAAGTACLTSCTTNTSCTTAGFCNASHVCAKSLHVALETGIGSCLLAAGNVIPQVQAALQARGHTVSIVSAADLGSVAAMAAYDVIVLDDAGNNCDASDIATFDPYVSDYVNGGGGLVATGWTLYIGPPAGIASVLPATPLAYLMGAETVTPSSALPITTGLNPFASDPTYTPTETPKAGVTQILAQGTTSLGQAWDVGQGRSVFLGPVYMGDFATYTDQHLTDGTEPDALELFLRSIEWAGHSL